MNFGPLYKRGGERRLNVAVTRETSEVIVFSSFDPGMVDLSSTQARPVEHPKNYLEFADRGPVALAGTSSANHGGDHFDSDDEQSVAMNLRGKGWKVQTQVGITIISDTTRALITLRPHPSTSGVAKPSQNNGKRSSRR
jgi:hypothetical protein